MPKEKVRSLVIKAADGERQTVVINGKCHEFNIYLSSGSVIDRLSKYYDLDIIDCEDLERMW